jgi:hypothetical protein
MGPVYGAGMSGDSLRSGGFNGRWRGKAKSYTEIEERGIGRVLNFSLPRLFGIVGSRVRKLLQVFGNAAPLRRCINSRRF